MSFPLKIAVTGAHGMLGTAILEYFSEHCMLFATSRSIGIIKKNVEWELFDLLDQIKLNQWLVKNKPDIVIHCAAMVNVDECESEIARAEALHIKTTKIIASTILEWNSRLIYISTDAVFDGKKEGLYTESDEPCPLNVYGRTKYLGEIETLNASESNLVLRTTIFGHQRIPGRSSFSDWILNGLINNKTLALFTDVKFTPIYVKNFSEILFKILFLHNKISGVFHLSSNTVLSKYEFGIQLATEYGLNVDNIFPSRLEDAKLTALRAKNMALSSEKLMSVMNIKFPTVQEGISSLRTYSNEV